MQCSFLAILQRGLCLSATYLELASGRPQDRSCSRATQRGCAGDPPSRVNADGLIPSICGRPKSWPAVVLISAFSLVRKGTRNPEPSAPSCALQVTVCIFETFDIVGTEILQICKCCCCGSKEHRDYVALKVPVLKKPPLLDSSHPHQ